MNQKLYGFLTLCLGLSPVMAQAAAEVMQEPLEYSVSHDKVPELSREYTKLKLYTGGAVVFTAASGLLAARIVKEGLSSDAPISKKIICFGGTLTLTPFTFWAGFASHFLATELGYKREQLSAARNDCERIKYNAISERAKQFEIKQSLPLTQQKTGLNSVISKTTKGMLPEDAHHQILEYLIKPNTFYCHTVFFSPSFNQDFLDHTNFLNGLKITHGPDNNAYLKRNGTPLQISLRNRVGAIRLNTLYDNGHGIGFFITTNKTPHISPSLLTTL